MFNNANGLNVGEATQINAQTYTDYSVSSSSVTVQAVNPAGGRYSNTVEVNAKTYIHNEISKSAMMVIHDAMSAGALHNSGERCDAPKCHPETRIAVQQEILSWITEGDKDDQPKKILWITGPAGTGKTAIAGSLAETCEERGLLAGSCFFSSYSTTSDRSSKMSFVATLVYGLLQHASLQGVRENIVSTVERDLKIFDKHLVAQCMELLIRPFLLLPKPTGTVSVPSVLIIDGLDEVQAQGTPCLDPYEARQRSADDQLEILSALLKIATDSSYPFRILVFSRPESVIRAFFTNSDKGLSRQLFLDSKYNPDSDIALLLTAKLTDIRRRYNLPRSWASSAEISQLVERASGQFIYAATVLRFLESGKIPPARRLEYILRADADSSQPNPFAHLDALYRRILQSCPDALAAAKWIKWIINFDTYPAIFVNYFLQDEPGQAVYLLESLASLIHIPTSQEGDSPYKLYHKSLLDFLNDERRCGRELHSSFKAGTITPYWERVSSILMAKQPPVVPETQIERKAFYGAFLQSVHERSGTKTSDPPFDHFFFLTDYPIVFHGFANCDVEWWIKTLYEVLSDEPIKAHTIATYLFHRFHYSLNPGGGIAAVCKRWKKAILLFRKSPYEVWGSGLP
ncbi:hypothetical protein NMY22_g11687 [Coprinellus aureogranulatus]|nr:hypothetical protein NMY22_g11687 [Coprinellus aureogranulatus]